MKMKMKLNFAFYKKGLVGIDQINIHFSCLTSFKYFDNKLKKKKNQIPYQF